MSCRVRVSVSVSVITRLLLLLLGAGRSAPFVGDLVGTVFGAAREEATPRHGSVGPTPTHGCQAGSTNNLLQAGSTTWHTDTMSLTCEIIQAAQGRVLK